MQGLDHILAMLVVGFWAAHTPSRPWLIPLTFVSVMGLGGLIGTSGLALPSTELIILLSGLALSVLAIKKCPSTQKLTC
jgi:urease accessory protein